MHQTPEMMKGQAMVGTPSLVTSLVTSLMTSVMLTSGVSQPQISSVTT